MFSKKPVIDQFSNEALGKFLESLPWIHVDDTNRELAREIVHLRTVEKISLVWSKIIASLESEIMVIALREIEFKELEVQ
jgi:hypothetical protein